MRPLKNFDPRKGAPLQVFVNSFIPLKNAAENPPLLTEPSETNLTISLLLVDSTSSGMM